MNQTSQVTPINGHEGRKYLRSIRAANGGIVIDVDVYAVLVAFGVTCPASAHAVKKLLAAGQRDKGDRLSDLKGALAAVNRAIELEQQRAVELEQYLADESGTKWQGGES